MRKSPDTLVFDGPPPTAAPLRVVSLLASATETVARLGCAEWLVGRSHECDYPAHVLPLPQISQPRVDIHGGSREIDTQVQAASELRQSLYLLNGELLSELRPDVILTQSHCAVCAVSDLDVTAALAGRLDPMPEVVALQPDTLADVWRGIQQVADALGVPERGSALISELTGRLESLRQRTAALVHPTVVCLEWLDPLMAAGNWMPELVQFSGGTNLFGRGGTHSPWLEWSQLVEADPDVIIALPCGWGVAKAREELEPLRLRSDWSNLRAVRNGRVAIADGNQFFNRPGPRLVDSAEILAEILHPGLFDFGHRGAGWIFP